MKLKLSSSELGHAALYTVLLIPFALLLTVVAVDVSGWNALRDKLQQEADRLAFQGLAGLPNSEQVKSRVHESANELYGRGVQSEVFFPGDRRFSVGVTLRAKYISSLDILLRPVMSEALSVQRSGVAQIVPGDFALIVVDGGSLRPQPSIAPSGIASLPAWGNPIDWPGSSYFQCVSAPTLSEPNQLNWNWWKDWRSADFRRWATQSCYNPVLTPLKLAAIGLSESILSYGVHRLAFIFTPGEDSPRGFRVVRHIHDESDSYALYRGQRGGFPPTGANSFFKASWGDYRELNRFLGDEVCMLLSQSEAGFNSAYEFPVATSPQAGCESPLEFPPCGGRHSASGHFADCYLDGSMSLRDAIYWNAAKLKTPSFSAEPNIEAALQQAWNELTDDRTIKTEQEIRGNLAASALRAAYVLTDHLPPLTENLKALLLAFQKRGITVQLLPFIHTGLATQENAELQSRSKEWSDYASETSNVRVSLVNSPEELQSVAAPRLLSSAIQFALRS